LSFAPLSIVIFGDALQIGIWDSEKGLKIDGIETDRNASSVPNTNGTRIITTILVSSLSLVI